MANSKCVVSNRKTKQNKKYPPELFLFLNIFHFIIYLFHYCYDYCCNEISGVKGAVTGVCSHCQIRLCYKQWCAHTYIHTPILNNKLIWRKSYVPHLSFRKSYLIWRIFETSMTRCNVPNVSAKEVHGGVQTLCVCVYQTKYEWRRCRSDKEMNLANDFVRHIVLECGLHFKFLAAIA